MGISKKELEKVTNNLTLHDEKNYLKIILESYSEFNHKARLEIAKILHNKFLEIPDDPSNLNLRKDLYAEIINKLMQSLEDAALLAMMFMDTKKSPIEHFTNNDNRIFVNFFKRARKGFSDAQFLRMYGLKPAKQLAKEGLIEQSEHQDFQALFNKLINSSEGDRKRWKGLGRAYTESYVDPSSAKRGFKKSGVVSVYHNIKHAYKVLLPTELFKQIWKYDEANPDLSVIINYAEFRKLRKNKIIKELSRFENKKLLVIGSFEINKKAVESIFERIFPQAQIMKNLAYLQLKKLDDPVFPVREFRFIIYKEKGRKQPKHFEKCPCGSGLKFKKCHQVDRYNAEDLFYKPKAT